MGEAESVSVELKAVPGFGFLPNDVVEITDLLFQVNNSMKRVLYSTVSYFWMLSGGIITKTKKEYKMNVSTNMTRNVR